MVQNHRVRQVFDNTHYRGNTTTYIIIISLFLIHVNMLEFKLTEEIKRCTVIVPMSEKKTSEAAIAASYNLPSQLSLKYGAN